MSESKPAYVMGHSDRERRRLALQAAVLNPLTDSFLRRAGISAGMRILDLGCGIGEVSLIAARLVGPHGHVRSLLVPTGTSRIALDVPGRRIDCRIFQTRGAQTKYGHAVVLFDEGSGTASTRVPRGKHYGWMEVHTASYMSG